MKRGNLHLTPHVVQALYTEAMLLADEARGYFDMTLTEARRAGVRDEITYSCEALKVTTRLMHCIAWILNQKHAADAASSPAAVDAARRPPGFSPFSNHDELRDLPDEARLLIAHSEALYRRLQRLHEKLEENRELADRAPAPEVPPVLQMIERLRASF